MRARRPPAASACAGDSARPGPAPVGRRLGRRRLASVTSTPAASRPRTTASLQAASRASSASGRRRAVGQHRQHACARRRRLDVDGVVGSAHRQLAAWPAPAPRARSSASAAPRPADGRCSRATQSTNWRETSGSGGAGSSRPSGLSFGVVHLVRAGAPDDARQRPAAERRLDEVARGDREPGRNPVIVGSGERQRQQHGHPLAGAEAPPAFAERRDCADPSWLREFSG